MNRIAVKSLTVPVCFLVDERHSLRGYSKEDRRENTHQGYNEHDVVENEIKKGMDPQFGDGHDIADGREIHLAGADHLRGSNDESKDECSR